MLSTPLGKVPLTLISFTPGEWVLGDWKEGEKKPPVPFKGSWQKASGQALQILDVGKRSREAYSVVAPIGLVITAADEENSVSGDRIIWEEKEYEVSNAVKLNNGLLPHWELICTRVSLKGNAHV